MSPSDALIAHTLIRTVHNTLTKVSVLIVITSNSIHVIYNVHVYHISITTHTGP